MLARAGEFAKDVVAKKRKTLASAVTDMDDKLMTKALVLFATISARQAMAAIDTERNALR